VNVFNAAPSHRPHLGPCTRDCQHFPIWPEALLIPNATHLTRSTAVTENILRIQLDFLRRTVAGSAG
jgi:hypothetical protein